MKRFLSAFLYFFVLGWCVGCGGGSSNSTGVSVNVTNTFATIETGTTPVTLSATVSGDAGNHGVTWTLTLSGASCSPSCGTLKPSGLTAVYTPPTALPLNQEATITARSVADNKQVFVFNFQILPPISVSISPKFSSVNVGDPVQNLTAAVTNDGTNSGVTWTLTVGGVDCQAQGCGTLTVDPAPSFTAHYTPPTTPPSAAFASPTITAISVKNPAKNDSFTFTIATPATTVTITNKFQSAFTGGQPINVNATLNNDFANQGVTWTLTSGGVACAATCGTLTAIGTPSTSASYTPPPTPAAGPIPSPTLTATSVADPTKSDSFMFSLVLPTSLVKGSYSFLLRGYDKTLQPMALAGSLTADGAGNITGGEYDLNDNTTVTSVAGPLSGSYSVDATFNGIPRVTFTIAGGGTTTVLKCALSTDGTRGKIIELDGSFALNAGTITFQDPTSAIALKSSASPTNFVFGLDSDAPLDARVVEAGQFILGAGATSVTGGIADEGQAGAANPVFGGVAGPAAISAGSSAATPPDPEGRGTLTLAVGGTSTQYAYYVVNATQFNLIEIDAGGTLKTLQAGTARNQKTLDATSIQTASVAALTGMTDAGGTPSPNVIIGVFSNTSGGAPQAFYDQNDSGTVSLILTPTGFFTVAFDPTTGRTVVSGTFFPDAVIYLYDSGSGYIADVTPSTDGVNHGFSGPLTVQVKPSTGGFAAHSLSGNSIALAGGTSSSSMTNLDLAANFDGTGNYSAEFDFTLSNLSIGSNGQGQNFLLTGSTYQVYDSGLGRGEMFQVPSGFFNNFPSQTDQMSFYLIGPNQFVAMEDAGLSPSGIMFFDPQ